MSKAESLFTDYAVNNFGEHAGLCEKVQRATHVMKTVTATSGQNLKCVFAVKLQENGIVLWPEWTEEMITSPNNFNTHMGD